MNTNQHAKNSWHLWGSQDILHTSLHRVIVAMSGRLCVTTTAPSYQLWTHTTYETITIQKHPRFLPKGTPYAYFDHILVPILL
jgi:hypothetical protein